MGAVMSMFPRWSLARWVLWVFCSGISTGYAQGGPDADSQLAKAHAVLTGQTHLAVVVTRREFHGIYDHTPMQRAAGFRILNINYSQVLATWRAPDDWRLVLANERDVNGQVLVERKLVFGKKGTYEAGILVLNQQTQAPARLTLPPALVRQEMLERGGNWLREDAVLSALLFSRDATALAAFGLASVTEPELVKFKGSPRNDSPPPGANVSTVLFG
jgi:hypothetical protein